MSTVGIIARPRPGEPGEYDGIYVHGDGQPDSLGAAVHRAVRERFGGDPEAALKHYIDAHPTGWSYVIDGHGEVCYCHDRNEGIDATKAWMHTREGEAANDWTYVLHADGLEIRRFAYGPLPERVAWAMPTDEIDWEALEEQGYKLS